MIIDRPDRKQLPQLRKLWQEAFGDEESFLEQFYQKAFSPSRCRCVQVDGELAAGLYWFDCEYAGEKIAYIYAVATAEKYRGRGIGRALMENTHAHLQGAGYAGAILVPAQRSLFAFYGAMGYVPCCTAREFVCAPGEEGTLLYGVSADAYAKLRRQMIVPGGVLQEGENLAFLQTQAKLYAGQGFLLAGTEEAGQFRAIELLGDMAAAPGILRTLGYGRGQFRVPGGSEPYAMYRHLDAALPLPTYLGFVFD